MISRRRSERISVRSLVKLSRSVTSSNKEKQRNKKQGPKRIKLNDTLNADKILQSSVNNSSRTPTCGLNRLKDSFFDVPCEDLAKRLLGKILVRQINDGTVLKGRIVETECYPGGEDKASCSYNGRITEKIKAVYMKPGTAFVYVTYGMYHCINISSQGAGAAVLLRALEPLQGLEFMQLERQKGRRTTATAAVAHKELQAHDLCNGPAKLCMSFGITKSLCNEQDLTVWDGMWIEEDESEEEMLDIVTSHRIGIDSVGTEWSSKPFRFYLLGNSSVSRRDAVGEMAFRE